MQYRFVRKNIPAASRLGSTRPVAVSQKAGTNPNVRFPALTPLVPP
jgi:hypothetical protein